MTFIYPSLRSIVFILFLGLFQVSIVESKTQPTTKNEMGIPFFKNISPKEYNANGQNWAAVQDSNGLLYFANAGGSVLQYDGVRWNSITVGNGSIVRDIQIDRSGTIFVGMQDEFGYLALNDSGKYVYHSLKNRIECSHTKFGDIWKTGFTKEYIYFLERHHLFRLSKKNLSDSTKSLLTIRSDTRFHNLFSGRNDQQFVHQVDVGLMETDADSLHLILNGDFFKKDLLAAVLPITEDEWLVFTRKRGLFVYSIDGQIKPFKTNIDDLLQSSQLYHAIRLSDGNFAIASKYGGLFIISAKGKLVQQINEAAGLANNTVWSVFEDAQHGIWLSLNEGITYVDYRSPFTTIDQRNGLKGSVHDIIRHKKRIYVTTNYGLFVSGNNGPVEGGIHFTQIPGINTSGWDLLSVWNTLFIVANSGIFQLKGNRAHLLFKYDPWRFYQSKVDSRRVYIGLVSGVASFYIRKDGSLYNEGTIPGIDIEARTLAEDDKGNLWVASSYQGVLCASSIDRYFNSGDSLQITHFNESSGLPGNKFVLLADGKNEVLFSTADGIYHFDDSKNKFSLNPDFTELNHKKLGDDTYLLTQPDAAGNIWNNIGQRIVLNQLSAKGNYHLIDTLFRGLPEQEIQCIFPDGEQFVWFGHRNGIIKYDKDNQLQSLSGFKTIIREVVLNNHVVLPANQSIGYYAQVPDITYSSENMLRLKFAAPFYLSPEKTVYQYWLENFDHNWSAWAVETQKDYTNLPHGKYTFRIKAKNVYGRIQEALPYSFVILPFWYQTTWFYLLFFLILTGMVIFLSRQLISYSHSKALLDIQRREEQKRNTEEAIRSQVAADFHDELGTRITRISLFSEILKGELPDASPSARGYLAKISKNADHLYDETRDFIWQLDPQKDALSDFVARMKSFGDELFENTDIQFDLEQQVENPDQIKLEMDQRRNLIRIIKEAMHNALKYAHCKNIILKISESQDRVQFIISDNGIGFTEKNGSDGIGLKNMRQRAEKIKAKLEINSKPDEGTQIILSVDL